MNFEKDFQDFVHLLNEYHIDYMVVGGYALAFHGQPRHTGDLDIWIAISESNANKMVSVLRDFGLASLGLEKSDFLDQGLITQLGYPPLRIDILNEIDGVTFNEAYLNKQVFDVDGLKISYIGLDDLIKNKLSSGRRQDITDVVTLNKLKK
ncbi:nucleotidyltransferase [Mucilaginibacter myungsuensis]|uniref:Nucleotidyltransferase n=1 Tax=Mucilaginibacter myungsuensis TaxID=649104 RepID=A0A929L0P3_9SPHI|nr:nucleotidyltransferase [Mucilaginibacter myungsuensis]MBE9662354.1 nucleotidyltransferase [Mucilaginibacter myungsuensis]MDN3599209.1 nucleotidyltransferase [Mucilaginibacter myungsuensis]